MSLIQHSTIEEAKNAHLKSLGEAVTGGKWMGLVCYIKEDGHATVDCTTFNFPNDRLDFAIREMSVMCDERRKEVVETNPPALPLAPHLKLAEGFDGAKITHPDGTVYNVELSAVERTPEQIKQEFDEAAEADSKGFVKGTWGGDNKVDEDVVLQDTKAVDEKVKQRVDEADREVRSQHKKLIPAEMPKIPISPYRHDTFCQKRGNLPFASRRKLRVVPQ